jgi:hypothetical protein
MASVSSPGVRLDQVRPGVERGPQGGPGGIDGGPDAAAVRLGGQGRVVVLRRSGGQAAAAGQPGDPVGLLEHDCGERLEVAGGEDGPGLVELGDRAVGLDQADVAPDVAGDRDGNVGHAGGVEQLHELCADETPGREHRDDIVLVRTQGEGHVDQRGGCGGQQSRA